jgi:hypothetical protein
MRFAAEWRRSWADGAIEAVLVDLLAGLCAPTGRGGQQPLFSVIDGPRQILVRGPAILAGSLRSTPWCWLSTADLDVNVDVASTQVTDAEKEPED